MSSPFIECENCGSPWSTNAANECPGCGQGADGEPAGLDFCRKCASYYATTCECPESEPQWPAALRTTRLRNQSLLDELEALADNHGRTAVLDALKAWAGVGPERELADIQQRVGSTALGWAVREFMEREGQI